MTAIEILMDEHRVIESAITALTAYARAIANGADLPRGDLSQFVTFLREFADAHHHGKEEDILFRAMVDSGFPNQSGPLAVMLSEHEEARRLTGKLVSLAEGGEEWGREDRRQLLFAATAYARLLREHIQKEDRVLYPMAVNMLPQEAWQRVEAEFSDFEASTQKAEDSKRFRRMAKDMTDRYSADKPAP